MNCLKCGAPLILGSNQCPVCGALVAAMATPPTIIPPVTPTPALTTPPATPLTTPTPVDELPEAKKITPSTRSKVGKPARIILAAAGAIACLFGIVSGNTALAAFAPVTIPFAFPLGYGFLRNLRWIFVAFWILACAVVIFSPALKN